MESYSRRSFITATASGVIASFAGCLGTQEDTTDSWIHRVPSIVDGDTLFVRYKDFRASRAFFSDELYDMVTQRQFSDALGVSHSAVTIEIGIRSGSFSAAIVTGNISQTRIQTTVDTLSSVGEYDGYEIFQVTDDDLSIDQPVLALSDSQAIVSETPEKVIETETASGQQFVETVPDVADLADRATAPLVRLSSGQYSRSANNRPDMRPLYTCMAISDVTNGQLTRVTRLLFESATQADTVSEMSMGTLQSTYGPFSVGKLTDVTQDGRVLRLTGFVSLSSLPD